MVNMKVNLSTFILWSWGGIPNLLRSVKIPSLATPQMGYPLQFSASMVFLTLGFGMENPSTHDEPGKLTVVIHKTLVSLVVRLSSPSRQPIEHQESMINCCLDRPEYY